MTLISDGIEDVRVFELPVGIWADGENMGSPRFALARWRSSWSDKFYQVYINGQYAGTTIDCSQRQMVIHIPSSFEAAVRIEVFGVEVEQAGRDFSDEVDEPPSQSGRVRISMLRSQSLPEGGIAEVYFDHGTGEIDYEVALNEQPIRVWPAWQDKAGFGMSGFGSGDFGYDSAAAVGFGNGYLGMGQFGLDADTIEWTSKSLPAGVYCFAVKIIDERGNEGDVSETGPITVLPAARSAEKVNVKSFDKETNQLILSIL